jgi:hypothetical protein
LAIDEIIMATDLIATNDAARDIEFFEIVMNALKDCDYHQEYFDPIYFTVMKEPVVISSGHVMDKSSILDDNQKLIFEECPFTREKLKRWVYPVNCLKSEIIDWTKLRLKHALALCKGYKDYPELAERALKLSHLFLMDLNPEIYTVQAQEF